MGLGEMHQKFINDIQAKNEEIAREQKAQEQKDKEKEES